MCFVEHNLAIDQSDVRFGLHKNIKRHFPSSRAIPSTSDVPFATPYKPGGCLLITDSCPTSRITTQGTDYLGRWSYVTLATQQGHQVCVITAYKPCQTSLHSTGPLTVYRQQWTILRSLGHDNPNPRSQFDHDLLEFLTHQVNIGNQIILTGDFNTPKTQSPLFEKLYDLGLRDMITDRHYNLPPFRSYQRGSTVIDYALCSLSILHSIRTSTYEPFHYSTHSDHRGILIDFDKTLLLGNPQTIRSPPHRGLKYTNEDQVEKYIQYLTQYWETYDITRRVQQTSTISDPTRLKQTLDSIDNDITNAFLKAERKVKLRDRPPWSPQLQQASLLVKRYQLILEEFKLSVSNAQAIQHTTQRITTTNLPYPDTKQACQQLLRKAQKNLRKVRKRAQELRAQHLDLLIERYRLNNDASRQQIIRRIQKAEAISRCYKKLRWILHPPHPGVTFIQRTTATGTETIYDRTELEAAILARNRQHFNQCAGTPFTTPPLTQLNWAADSLLAESILEGTCDISTLTSDHHTATVLTNCKRRTPEQDLTVTSEDLTGLFKAWNERTSTSPSGRHLGLYKAIFCNPSEQAHSIASTLLLLINTLLKHGLSLERWKTVSNMMIHKVEGSYFINKLRVIHLFEADYNGLIGLLFNRKLLYSAEHLRLLNNNQWGSRPHRQTEDALLLKELTYDLSYCTKTTLATFDNDATGCYDRVPCSIAMLASRRLGASKAMCQLQANTLQTVTHQLRTAFGTSAASYTSSPDFEIHGQGQGSRAAPPTWVFVSSLLLDCLQQQSYGLHFTCPSKQLTHSRSSDAFVDDVTGFSNVFCDELQGANVVSQVIHQMQHDAALWNRLLHTSGGKLALHKCLYYILKWQWRAGIASHVPPNLIHPTIHITDEAGIDHPIHHQNCQQAHRTLGQMKSPIPNAQAQIQFMSCKSNEWLSAIRSAKLSRTEAQAAFETIWFPSVSYGLGTTNLSYPQLNQIQSPIMNHILPLMGYNRHFPRAVVFGSRRFGGMQLKHLYSEQGIKHITQFLKYFRADNSVGGLLHITLRWIRLIAGTAVCPLLNPQYDFSYIQHPWFCTLLRFMRETQSTIETVDPFCPLSRSDDSSLMEDFFLHSPTSTELKQLNRCRLFLRVLSESDILNATGTQILQNCWRGLHHQPSPYLWPIQPRPSNRDWTTWRKYLMQCYLSEDQGYSFFRNNLQILHPLGSWNRNHLRTSVREFYIHPPSLQLYQRFRDHYIIHKPNRTTRTLISFVQSSFSSYLPPSTHPVDVQRPNPNTYSIPKSHIWWQRHRTTSSPITTFDQYLQTLDPWDSLLLQHYTTSHDLHQTASLLSHPYIIATDGSDEHGKGSFGWVISHTSGLVFASGQGTAYGSSMSSFRAEAYGILSVSRFVLHLHRFYHIPQQHFTVDWWCDCQSLLQRLSPQHSYISNPNRYTLADHDLELAIHQSRDMLSVCLQPHHLYSHQYDAIPMEQLEIPPRLNRIADTLAKQHNKTMASPATHVPLISPARCQLNIQGKTVSSKLSRRLWDAYTETQSLQHLQHCLHLRPLEIHMIAWDEFAKAFSSFSPGSQRIIRRWIYAFLPTQRRLHRTNTSTNSLCPICRTSEETDLHFLLCQGAASWEESLFHPLSTVLQKHPATHWVDNALLINLRRFLNQQPPRSPSEWIHQSVTSQSVIGWELSFRGLFSKSWIHQQNQAAQHGSRLLVKIIKCIFHSIVTRWNTRNQCLHRKSPDHHELKDRLRAKLIALYELQDKVLPGDRGIFSIPLDTLLQANIKTQQVFLKQHTSLAQKSVQQQRSKLIRQHPDIASFFRPHTNPS